MNKFEDKYIILYWFLIGSDFQTQSVCDDRFSDTLLLPVFRPS